MLIAELTYKRAWAKPSTGILITYFYGELGSVFVMGADGFESTQLSLRQRHPDMTVQPMVQPPTPDVVGPVPTRPRQLLSVASFLTTC